MKFESFGSTAETVRNAASSQRAELEAQAHPESKNTLTGLRKWAAMAFMGAGSLVAMGCDKAGEHVPVQETNTAAVQPEYQKSEQEVDFMSAKNSETIGVINEQGHIETVQEKSSEPAIMTAEERKEINEKESLPVEQSVIENTLSQTMLGISQEYAILNSNETAFRLMGDADFHIITGDTTVELEKVIGEGLRSMRNFNEQKQPAAAEVIKKQMVAKIKEIVTSGKNISPEKIPNDKKTAVKVKVSESAQNEIDKL